MQLFFFMVNMASGMDHGRVRPQQAGHPANARSCSLGLQHISLILDIHIMFNWQLSYQEIRWPVSRDHIAGSGLELIEVACFFEVDRWPNAGFQLEWGFMLRPIYTLRLCRTRQAYDRFTTWIVSFKSNLQLAYDCRVGPKWCRRPVVSLLYAYRVKRPLGKLFENRKRLFGSRWTLIQL